MQLLRMKIQESTMKHFMVIHFVLYCLNVAYVHLNFKCTTSSSVEEIVSTVFSLFALYTLYNTQPFVEKVKVNINLGTLCATSLIELWNSFVEVYKYIQANMKETDYLHLLKMMRAQNCFSFGVITGLKTILLDTHGYILKK